MTHKIDVTKLCTDYKEIKPGEWSEHTFQIDETVFSLFHEEDGSYTLFGERNDEVVFCSTIELE